MAYTLADDNKYNELILAARAKGDQALVSKYEQAQGMRVPASSAQSALTPKASLTPQQESYNQLMRMRDELGVDWEPTSNSVMLNREQGVEYNPTTGSYSVKNPGGTGQQSYAFGYDPTKNQSSIYGTTLSGALDPRIALGMADEDYSAADKWQKSIWDQIDAKINEGVVSGEIAPGYSVEQKGSGMSLNDWAGAANASPTDKYLKNLASRDRYNSSSIDQYLQRANPDLYKQYKTFSNDNDTTGASMYMEQAYKNAQSRLGSQYQDDYYGGLKTQFQDLRSSLMNPDQKTDSDRQAIMDNPDLSPVVKDAILKGMEPKDSWGDLMKQYGPQPPQTTVAASAKPAQTEIPTAVTPAVPTASDYAKEMVSQNPAPVSPSSLVPAPTSTAWSKDFETKSLDLLGGVKNSLDDYIKMLGTPSKASFGLNNNMAGDTGQRNSGLVSSVPQPFGSTANQTASPFTGKAGAGSTTTSTQSLWR